MPIGRTNRFSFTKRYSAWEINQAWRAKRREMMETFQAQSAAASSGFMSAWTNQINGSAEVVTRTTLARLQAEAKAKTVKALGQLNVLA